MKISELMELLESELEESGDLEINIYDSSGNRIEPSSFSYGGRSTATGFVDTCSLSDLD